MLHPFHVSSGHRFVLQTKFVAPALLLTDGHKWQWRRAQQHSASVAASRNAAHIFLQNKVSPWNKTRKC